MYSAHDPSPGPATVDLAREADFRLGPWLVRPSRGLAERPGRTERLEPRVLQTLVVLVRAAGATVSRAELMRQAWGLTVSDDAVGRCVARLRAVLGDEVPIETLPKIGYRLVLPPGGADVSAALEPPAPARRPFPLPAALAGAALLAGAAMLALPPGGRDAVEASSGERVVPVTVEPGRELYPALSRSGGQLAYAARPSAAEGLDIWVRALDGGTPVRVTDDPLHDAAPAWSPDGSRLAFVRTDEEAPCRILVKPVPAGPEREVGRCAAERITRLSWLGPGRLAYSDAAAAGEPVRVLALDVDGPAGTAPVPLTDPPAGILGDLDAEASPDGTAVAFLRVQAPGVADVFVQEIATGAPRQVTRDGRKLHGLAWSADGRSLFVASSRTGDFGLWEVDAAGTGEPRRLAPGLSNLGRVAAAPGRVAAELRSPRANLFAAAPGGAPEPAVPPSNRYDWSPDVAADGTVAFVSDRSGSFEVWAAAPGAPPRQLTGLRGPFAETPRWSPDGSRVAFATGLDGNLEILVVDRAGGRPRRLTDHPGEDRAPAWSRDGNRLYFASNRDGAWRIWAVDPASAEARPVTPPGWRAAMESPDGRWLYLAHATEPGLWRRPVEGGEPERVTDLLAPADAETWTVGPAGPVLVSGGTSGGGGAPTRLLLLPAGGGAPVVLAEVPDMVRKGGLALRPDGAVVFSGHLGTEVDISLVELAPR